MRKYLLTIVVLAILLSISACSSDTEVIDDFNAIVPTNITAETIGSPDIAFAFLDRKPLSSEILPVLDESTVRYVISSGQTMYPGIVQGFYRKNNTDEPQNIYSYVEINGIKYDIGHVAFGEDRLIGNGFGQFHFWRSSFNLDESGTIIYEQYKIYGAKYDAIAFYKIENEKLIFLCEIPGVIAYSDYDMSGVTSILSTTRTMPFTDYTISKLDLRNNTLHFTKLTELLNCDGVDYAENSGLFFTYHKPADTGRAVSESGYVYSERGNVYSFENGVFILRYIPVKR